MTSRAEAVESLLYVGLTEYEARCYTALTQLSDGTAKEISEVAGIPQSRVYDVASELHEKGLIDVQESTPRRYFAIPVDQALARLRQEYAENLDLASEQLSTLEARRTGTEGVWEIASKPDIEVRITMHLRQATDEVYLLVGADDLLGEETIDALQAAHERGATVYVEVPSIETRNRVHQALPGAHIVRSDLPGIAHEDRQPGRLLMVDSDVVLLSEVTAGLVPGETDEEGLWGRRTGYGLVSWIRPLLRDRIARLENDRAESCAG